VSFEWPLLILNSSLIALLRAAFRVTSELPVTDFRQPIARLFAIAPPTLGVFSYVCLNEVWEVFCSFGLLESPFSSLFCDRLC